MAAETQTLNFGPEWLRALSSGGSVMSPPPSPALPKYKLADYRYGREEMLALYLKDNKIPSDLQDKEFLPILQEEPLLPLALVPFTEEEQRNFSMSVNSAAVLRLTGRGGGTVVGAPRGRSSSRGRGRGRGEGSFYQRSFDEVDGGFGRGTREMHRSQSWEERGDRRFEKPGRKEPVRPTFEEGGTAITGRKHEFTRSESENWRILREELNGEDEEGGVWRLAGSRRDGERWRPHSPDGLRAPGWREHAERRRRFDFDFRERDDERGYRRVRSGSNSAEEDKDILPEWCLEDAEEEMGTFDSSGAFLPSKKVQKEPIPEEQELDFRPSEEEEHSDSEGSHNEEAKEPDKLVKKEAERTEWATAEQTLSVIEEVRTSSPAHCSGSPPEPQLQELALCSPSNEREQRSPEPTEKPEVQKENALENTLPPKAPSKVEEVIPAASSLMSQRPPDATAASTPLPPCSSPIFTHDPSPQLLPTPVTAAPGMGNIPIELDDDEGLKHLEQQAEKMVAYLQDSALDDERLAAKIREHRAKVVSMPLSHEILQKWFYKDPQGEIQGPFNNQEMTEWFQAGYFTMSLLVKRACDESFQPLGDIIKMWGRMPFTPGPAPPPLLGDLDQERLSRQQKITALYQLQHLQYQQFLIQQQYAQVLAQQQKSVLSSQEQQQLALLLQQFQTLKMRISEQNTVPPVTRSMSVPDTGSIWELQTTTSQPAVWEGSSVWDLPVDTASQSSALGQLQQLEKAKAAKLEHERREVEMRVKREEEERKRQEELRRQQEELLRRQQEEEERKRHEEEELARRKQEEALRRQREQELALRLQREEEERKQQEEALRRLEERRREDEERHQREELLRKQEEEAAKWAREEEEAAQRLMEENRIRTEEETARLRQEEEDRKRKELELQRQKELLRQRQQQQEALRRLQQQQQQQQLAQMKLPSSSTWGQQANSAGCSSQATLSLTEIQKLEEEREQQLQEERRQQRELMKALHQQQLQQQQQQKLSSWGNVSKSAGITKSLLEIQQEEARQMQKHQQQNRARGTTIPVTTCTTTPSNLHSSIGNSVWGAINASNTSQWTPDVVSSIWSSVDSKNSNMGFWDDAVKDVGPRNSANKNKNNANLSKPTGVSSRQNKKVEEEEKVLKLFQGVNKAQDGFTQWCEQMLHALNTANNLDVPTFVSFLKEVESPYEVHDYIRAYLGDTPEAKEFAKQFLERRAKQKATQQRQQDSLWGMSHSALQSVFQNNHSNSQQSNFETAQSVSKKKKKQKMVRADPSLLGFSVNASSERLNMGEIETLDDY
uniref:GRB10-interacting GYF protein 2 isoform X1 n=1 Tax=Geotrypetes seraphini TaxID=260995 RepID=A0A6P8SJC2_GEOSA|nr:GRB10-interacting GYF protein 2 isoform X1 [Geotrypetes seraphini]XP_033815426.1 GRB10-interacting GYF protein 2 isoform X1 [Geotrypetes seraphini]